MKRLLMASICIPGLSGSAFAIDANANKTVHEAAQAWEILANKGDITTWRPIALQMPSASPRQARSMIGTPSPSV
jgi:hypothetical protein